MEQARGDSLSLGHCEVLAAPATVGAASHLRQRCLHPARRNHTVGRFPGICPPPPRSRLRAQLLILTTAGYWETSVPRPLVFGHLVFLHGTEMVGFVDIALFRKKLSQIYRSCHIYHRASELANCLRLFCLSRALTPAPQICCDLDRRLKVVRDSQGSQQTIGNKQLADQKRANK